MSSLKPDRPDEGSRFVTLAVRWLRRGVRSESEVLAYLRRRGCSAATASRVIAECRARGLLDDEACARLWADQWARRGYAWTAIREKLSVKGLPGPAIDRTGSRLGLASGDESRARQLVTSALPRAGHATPQQASRLARMLTSRGFDADVIERVLTEHFEAVPSD